MSSLRRSAPAAALIAAAAGCATMANGTTQRIPVTSEPAGAQVFVDGRPAGSTPVQVTVSRRGGHEIRVKKAGYGPIVHRLQRRENLTEVLWDVALGIAITSVTGRLMLGDGEGSPTFLQTLAAVSAGATPGIIDYTNGAAFRFQSRLDLDLPPVGWSTRRLKPSPAESVHPVQPVRGVLLRDVQRFGDLDVRALPDVSQPHHLAGRAVLRRSDGRGREADRSAD